MLKVEDDGVPLGPAVFVAVIPVRWGDMDADGHVNSTVFFRYFEEARMSWASSLGLAVKPPGVIPVVKNTACRFDAPIGYPCNLAVRIHCARLGNSSLSLGYTVVDAADPQISHAMGSSVWVWIASATGRPVAMPEVLRSACSAA